MKTTSLIFSFLATASFCQAAVHTYTDSTWSFRQVITDEAGVDVDGNDKFNNTANWEVNTSLWEDDSVDDQFGIGWTARHLIAPHGEGAAALWVLGNFVVNAENYAAGNGHELNWNGGPIRHGDHADVFAAKLTFDLTESRFDWDQVTKYTFVFVGKHIVNPYDCVYASSVMTGQNQVPSNDSTAHANLIFDTTYSSQTFGITMGVMGISRDQIIGARLYRGVKGQQGTPIADIAPGQAFVPTGHNSCSLTLENLPFSFQYAKDLTAGRLYVSIMTQRYPNGEIRGQLKPMKQAFPLH